ncbi:unnamed protein product [Calypogeia fissa]
MYKPILPFSSRDTWSSRYGGRAMDQPVSGRVDPLLQHESIDDDMISELSEKVHRLKTTAHEIGSEARSQNKLLDGLQSTMHKAQDKLSGTMNLLKGNVAQKGSKHIKYVVIFVFLCMALIILWTKLFKA